MAEFCRGWHQLGSVCDLCGYVSVPARFYWYAGGERLKKERSHGEAVAAFEAWRAENRAEIQNRAEIPGGINARKGRPKKWGSEAERMRAYRERQ